MAIALAYLVSSHDAQLASSHGSGNASFRIWGAATGSLYPGAPAVPVDLGFANPNTFAITVSNVRVRIAGTSSPACDVSNFLADGQLADTVEIPASAERSLSQLGVPSAKWPRIAMADSTTSQDACKSASLRLLYDGEAAAAVPADTPIGVASGLVYVNGKLFRHGGIAYGARVLIRPGGKLKLQTIGGGTVMVYPPAGKSVRFVVHRVFVAAAAPPKGTATSSASRRRLYIELRLTGGLSSCRSRGAASAPAHSASHPARSLWAKGSGRLRIRGRFAISTASDAWWLTQDRCRKTLVRAKQHTIRVDNITTATAMSLSAGRSYTAYAPTGIGPRQPRGRR